MAYRFKIRKDFKISRGRDGTLIVRHVNQQARKRFRWSLLVVVTGVLMLVVNLSPARKGLSAAVLGIIPSAPVESLRETTTIKLPISATPESRVEISRSVAVEIEPGAGNYRLEGRPSQRGDLDRSPRPAEPPTVTKASPIAAPASLPLHVSGRVDRIPVVIRNAELITDDSSPEELSIPEALVAFSSPELNSTPVSIAPVPIERPVERVAGAREESPQEGDDGLESANRRSKEAATSEAPRIEAASVLDVQSVTVKRGDSLSAIFKRLGLDQGQLVQLSRGKGKPLARIHPGQRLEFHTDPEHRIEKLVYRLDPVSSLHFHRTATGYTSEQVEEPYERRRSYTQATIDDALFLAGQRAGLPDKTIMQLVEIFGWDVDFALDIRKGDRFTVVYEELFKGEERAGYGDVLAAEFVNQGRTIRALRYTDENGNTNYFSPDGGSMRKAFLRTPVRFSRISSHFDMKRKHPILHTIRAHKGVDYAARTGTPVKATGDGKVTFAGWKGGYGKTIVVRHGGAYTTLYAHLSRLAKGMRSGKHVRQGDIIGYVGKTGLATGPHLHYEFRVKGAHRNPLKVKLPKASPIAPKLRPDFIERTRELVAQLDLLSRTQLASSD